MANAHLGTPTLSALARSVRKSDDFLDVSSSDPVFLCLGLPAVESLGMIRNRQVAPGRCLQPIGI